MSQLFGQQLGRLIATTFVILNSGALDKVCWNVESELQSMGLEGQDVVDFAMDYLSKGDLISLRTRNHLKKSLQKVIDGEECSRSSLDYVATIGECRWERSLKPLASPATEYAIKCLTPEHLKEVLLTETETIFDLGRFVGGKKLWEVIDEQFIEDYLEANPTSKGKRILEIEFLSDELVAPFVKLLKRYATKREKEFRTEGAVRDHIERYVVAPCRDYKAAAQRVMDKIDEAGHLFPKGGKRKLYQSLDREAQMVILRRNLCEKIPFALADRALAAAVLKQL